jgi:indolepyruvate ferredoxin oxidoreductase alpha subunit
MKTNEIRELCTAEAGRTEVLQGNIAFAVGVVRAGIHSADGYAGTPSTEVIDRGLSQVQDMVTVGWSVNEAVAAGVGLGHSLAGRDCVVTMKIPGLFQAGDIITSSAFYHQPRGALIYYIASDFTPSSTQHVIDPRYLFKSCCLPVFEPADHQQMLEAGVVAVEIGRTFNTPVVILASGALCHSEGLVRLTPVQKRDPVTMPDNLRAFNCLPAIARKNYESVMRERMTGLADYVETSPHNQWIKGGGKTGIITYGANTIYAKEVRQACGADIDILSLAFTHPLPKRLIRNFCAAISGKVYVIEDGYRYLQDEITLLGISVQGKEEFSTTTEYSPALVAQKIGYSVPSRSVALAPVQRPPMICAGCPYRLFADAVRRLRKKGQITASFGDIGCNALLYFMDALDTGVAMGASEAKRTGYVLSRPEEAARCISVIGDSTECHTGMDATRNAIFRHVPGVKIVLDNYWTAMTGGQPAPTSPINLAGQPNTFDLVAALQAHGANVLVIDAYDRKALRQTLRQALAKAAEGLFSTVVVRGSCMKKVHAAKKKIRLRINTEKCQKCYTCLICAGNEIGPEGFPIYNNLCSGCGDNTPACLQMCPFDAIEYLPEEEKKVAAGPAFATPPPIIAAPVDKAALPDKLALAIRGVGGQGNLFFGRVLTQLAFLASYGDANIVKGETHGMAQMGGPVISTFSCGMVYSPVLLPGTADCLIAMETSEVLRPGFLDLLKDDGTILMAKTAIVPPGVPPEQYPRIEEIQKAIGGLRLIQIDVLGAARGYGDSGGRTANVVMMGALSKVAPFDAIDAGLWLEALKKLSPSPTLWAANYTAFMAGKKMI